MKIFRKLITLLLLAIVIVACKEKSTEKKITDLENHLAETKGQNATTTSESEVISSDAKPEGPLPIFAFETTDHDFGTINEGDVVEYTYKFKNTGDAPLIIQGAQGSCGCTVPVWTKEPIPAGGSGVVTAKFDSHGKQNVQNKTVTVTSNTWPKQTVLHFKAMVNPKASTEMGPLKK